MKTIKIWVNTTETTPMGVEGKTIRALTDFTFSEAVVLGHYVLPFKVHNEPEERIVIVTAIGTFQAPYSLSTEKVVEECVERNAWKYGIGKKAESNSDMSSDETFRYHVLCARATLYPGKTIEEVNKIIDELIQYRIHLNEQGS